MVKITVLPLLSLLCDGILTAIAAETEECSVVVVGGGVAGLATAQTLKRYNCSVTVLEARDVIGGRLHTLTEGPFAGVEQGGHWVHGGLENAVSAPFLSYLGIPFVPIGGNDDFEGRRGHLDIIDGKALFTADQRSRAFKLFFKVEDAADDYLESQMTVDCDGDDACRAQDVDMETAWAKGLATLDPKPSDEELKAVDLLKRLCYEQDGGNLMSKLSGRVEEIGDYTDFYPHGGHGDAFVEGGYISLIRTLALNVDVRTSSPVTQIQTGVDRVVVQTADETFTAKFVVVTPFAHVARQIVFDPPLPDWKDNALRRMGAGKVAKALVLLKEPLDKKWDHVYTFARISHEKDLISMCVRSAAEHPRLSNFNFNRTLECFVGAGAVEEASTLSPEELRETAEAQLRDSFGSTLAVESLYLTPWVSDPFIGLAWSYPPVGTVKQDYLDYAKAVGRVHFAGEATCYLMWGNVHAALATAGRVVHELAGDLPALSEAIEGDDWPLMREESRTACEVANQNTKKGMRSFRPKGHFSNFLRRIKV